MSYEKNPLNWHCKQNISDLTRITMNTKPAPQLFSFFPWCCKTTCGTKCSCKVTGLGCSIVCLHCDLDVCENALEVSLNIEEDKYYDQEVSLLSSEHMSKQNWSDFCSHSNFFKNLSNCEYDVLKIIMRNKI